MFEKRRALEIANRLAQIEAIAIEQARHVHVHDDETGEPLYNEDGSPRRPDMSFTTEQYMEHRRLVEEGRKMLGKGKQ